MKLKFGLLLILTSFFQHLKAQNNVVVFDQEITIEAINEPVSIILKQVEKQVHRNFSYDSDRIDTKRKQTVSFKRKPLSEVISILFDNKINYKIKGNYIVLYKSNVVPLPSSSHDTTYTDRDNRKYGVKKVKPENSIPLTESVKMLADTSIQPAVNTLIVPLEKSKRIQTDSIALYEPKLILINNDSTILLLEKDTTETP